MMNFSAFGGPFSGIHQFAAKFDAQTPGAFGTPPGNAAAAAAASADNHVQRYQTNGNHFNQNVPNVSAANNMQYGQNISIPYSQPQSDLNFLNAAAAADHKVLNQQILQNVNQSWQTLANTANTVDYSSHLLSATLPISIQHFLKYSETIKKESSGDVLKNGTNLASLALGGVALTPSNNGANGGAHHNGGGGGLVGMDHGVHMTNMTDANGAPLANGNAGANGVNGNANGAVANGAAVSSTAAVGTTNATGGTTTTTGKKTKKKKPPKEKKPRPKPGEIRETKALDGSTLYCCPECQMAYPDRSLIEQHVISHAVERRFVCDICNAALKRKDHLTRHKLSHIPDRPHVCNICMKSFKRKEQLTLHIVIHSGEKKHVCIECGKGFYRKDHLRKHTRSHIARRVKSEVSAQNVNGTAANNAQNNALHGS
ncbi:zinc finger protein Gfi-1 isoform X2 [Scaptodrosophila lebanonensis]|uniref:Zinc finger protein Gfi-1 isoform X2 n=1 Tax=Drosophila lebanonensis TaxID=7225 RepID=A0A6J2TEZ1_DROLE|nr:zinc finger protein Gfi-1 isoform X2 [Scaptodrosophila lebanonensis]